MQINLPIAVYGAITNPADAAALGIHGCFVLLLIVAMQFFWMFKLCYMVAGVAGCVRKKGRESKAHDGDAEEGGSGAGEDPLPPSKRASIGDAPTKRPAADALPAAAALDCAHKPGSLLRKAHATHSPASPSRR